MCSVVKSFYFTRQATLGKLSKALEKAQPAEENATVTPGPSSETQPIPPPSHPGPVRASGNGFRNGTDNINRWDERLRKTTAASSPVAESLRRLRTAILHPAEGPPPKSILVLSATVGEGKSSICANLGVAIAQGMEQHALLVDCDLRRPTLSALFGIPNDSGLVDHLQHGTDLTQLIRKSGLPKLSLIPSGQPPENPSELLGSQTMTRMIDEMTSRYPDRFILLDSPPMQAASETAVLAKHVDGVVLVVRWSGADRIQVKELVDTLGKNKIIGTVFNAYEENVLGARFHKKGYYGYYSKGYSK